MDAKDTAASPTDWHALDAASALRRLGVEDALTGLSFAESERRLAHYGPNRLPERQPPGRWRILLSQFKSLLVLILVAAAGVSVLLGDLYDAAAIAAIVVLNALLGYRQEYRAERAIAALRDLAQPQARLRREGSALAVLARQLVPGDIVLLEAGDRVPADCRLLESHSLRIQESALTGESASVDKDSGAQVSAQAELGDRACMAYMGTSVVRGRASALVVETGRRTQLGRIAVLLDEAIRGATPLQKRLDRMGRALAGASLALVAAIAGIGLLRGEELRLVFLTAVSMAVAVIPEGLPAVVTIALALAAQRMLSRRALIRKLPAVETLGSIGVICSDKTGTLTQNRMTASCLDTCQLRIEFSEFGPSLLSDKAVREISQSDLSSHSSAVLALAAGMLCNDAVLDEDPSQSGARVEGDPTEAALVLAAAGLGFSKNALEAWFPRSAEIPFDSQRKRMSTIHRLPPKGTDAPPAVHRLLDWIAQAGPGDRALFAKGAVDSLLEVCSRVWLESGPAPLDAGWKRRILEANDRRAGQGLRVLGLAFKPCFASTVDPSSASPADCSENGLIFIGMAGLLDPPRPEARRSVRVCRQAGIRPIMITGDHPRTASEIARRIGIDHQGGFLTGRDLERMPPEELQSRIDDVSVFARVSPEHKLRIVEALQRRGQVVAMTGDGVNDAPALKKADIGVAMGLAGTDAAKQSADMVLLDDDFSTIVRAVREGRVIYSNMRRFVTYLLGCNLGEVWVMLIGPLLGLPLPLLPLQILWMNLVTDGLPALALGMEKGESDTMKRPPHPAGESVFARGVAADIIWIGLLLGTAALGVGLAYWWQGSPKWQTMLFATLTVSQLSLSLALRSRRESVLALGLFSNPHLLAALAATFALQLGILYLPAMQRLFRTQSLALEDLFVVLAMAAGLLVAVEIVKAFKRFRSRTAGRLRAPGSRSIAG